MCVCVLCGQMAMEIEWSSDSLRAPPHWVGTPQKSHHPRPKGAGLALTFSAHAQNIPRGRIKTSCCRVLSLLRLLEMTFCDQAYSDLAFEWLNDSTTANYVREYDYSWRPVKLSTKDDI